MQSKTITKAAAASLLPLKNDQVLQRVHCSVLTEGDKLISHLNTALKKNDEAERVECECCGMCEECTPTYINRIKECFCDKWVCGLCSEAVKEKMEHGSSSNIEEALQNHMAFCKQFNGTIRRNPKLSLAGAMRDIARKSSQHRNSKEFQGSKIARTVSYGPMMGVRTR